MSVGILLIALALNQPQLSQSPFNGAWLTDLASSTGSTSVETFSIGNGSFSRGNDKPDLAVRMDGAFHVTPKDDYVDAVAVKFINSRQVQELDRFRGRLVYSVVYTVSDDGSTMIERVSDTSKPDPKPIVTTMTYRRIGKLERGIALNGRWKVADVQTTKDHLIDIIKLGGNHLSMIGAGGYGYDAVIGGPPVPVRGDAETGRTSVTMPNDRMILEHMSLNGVATIEKTMTLLSDDKTIKVSGTRLTDGSHFTWIMHKQ